MSFDVEDRSRIGRSTYWLYYVGTTVAFWAMTAWAVYQLLKLDTIPIVFGLIAPTALYFYFRVIAMRRCRDIGWPAFLPWLIVGLIFVCSFVAALKDGVRPEPSLETLDAPTVITALLGVTDFVFLIVIGCLGSARPDLDAFGEGPLNRRQLPDNAQGYVDVMGRTVADRPAKPLPEAFGNDAEPVRTQPGPPPGGFGRRVV